MWHPRVRTRRTGGFRSHGSHASKRRSSRRNRPINQSINHLECAHNQLLHVYTHTHGGGNRRIVRPLRTVMVTKSRNRRTTPPRADGQAKKRCLPGRAAARNPKETVPTHQIPVFLIPDINCIRPKMEDQKVTFTAAARRQKNF